MDLHAAADRVRRRADAVRARLAERGTLPVTDMNNVRWLTGFTGSSGLVVLLPDPLVLVTDGRYADRAAAELAAAGVDADIRIGFTHPSSTTVRRPLRGRAAIGADSSKLSHRWQALAAELASCRPTA